MMKRFIVAGIGTDVGKTVAAAVLSETLGATYWKPVQTGSPETADALAVRKLCGDTVTVKPGVFHFDEPASPHFAGKLEGVEISREELGLPEIGDQEAFVLEIAGGIMVPLNNAGLLTIEMIQEWKLPVMLVTRHYLGSINHTLLTLSELQSRRIPVAGMILNGPSHEPTESIYRTLYPEMLFLELPEMEQLDKISVEKIAEKWRKIIG